MKIENARSGDDFVGHLEMAALGDPSDGALCRISLTDATEVWRAGAERAEREHRERNLRERMDEARARFDRLTAASVRFVASIDEGDTASTAASIGVPELGHWCAVDLLTEKGIRRAAVSAMDPLTEELPLSPIAPRGSASVVRSGLVVLVSIPSHADLLGLAAASSDLGALWSKVGSYLCVPLRAHGRTMGAISFVRAKGDGRPYGPEDVGLAEELANRAALALENERLYHDLQSADRHKDEFLAMLGHELRNPLAAVLLAGQNLRRPGADESDVRRAASVLERQSKHLVRLVDDLLDVSRVARGKDRLAEAGGRSSRHRDERGGQRSPLSSKRAVTRSK